jgi:UDP-4-amino-4,6-dideoxy-N-acetyl-beta-L-altrosamine N-acetyltransferase
MIIEQYGVTLKRLTLEDIELVRYWRNHPVIQKTMIYQVHITKEQQLKWFHSINNKFNYYFLIIYDGITLGVLNAKNISEEKRTSEGGIFIWENSEKYDLIPAFSSLASLNVIFKVIDFMEKSIIQVRRDNPKAIYYNTVLGYKVNEQLSTTENCFLELTKSDYFENTMKLNKVAQRLTNDYNAPRVTGEFSTDLFIDSFREILK